MTVLEAKMNVATTDEHRLIERLRGGDQAAGDALLAGLRGPLLSLALQLLGNREDARDVVQESLTRFLGALPRFDGDRPIKPFLFRIVRNLCTDRFRSAACQRVDPLQDHFEPRAGTADPEKSLAQKEQIHALWAAMARLDDPHREILVLRDYHDLSYAELAEVLGIPRGTVMSRLHAARQKLRQAFMGGH